MRSTRAGARKLFERIAPRQREMRRPTPYNTLDGGSTSEWPFLQTNLFVVTNSTNSFQVFFASTSSCFIRSLQQRWPLRYRARLAAHVMIDEHARYPRPAQLLRFLKSSKRACVKISASVWGILGDANVPIRSQIKPANSWAFRSHSRQEEALSTLTAMVTKVLDMTLPEHQKQDVIFLQGRGNT